jgi:undecaprenyl-diphosphatase
VAFLTSIQTLDESILAATHGAPSWAVPFFYGFTTIGAGWGLLFLLPFLVRPRWRRETAWCLLGILTTSLITSLVKDVVMRVRPCNALAWCSPIDITTPAGFSFPSGHASGSFAFAAFIAVRRPRLAALAFTYASIVGWSRCVLGVHYPSDVFAGALLGTTIGASFAVVFTKRTPLGPPAPGDEGKNEAVASSEPRVS